MNPNVITGGCLCGSVRYEIAGPPDHVTHCHCSDCRRSSGAAFVTWASFRRDHFKFTSGLPRGFRWAGRWRSFCPFCGTPLTFLTGPDAAEIDVTVCSMDEPAALKPADHSWIEDRLPWARSLHELPTFGQGRLRHSA